jgi:hypothetical protein
MGRASATKTLDEEVAGFPCRTTLREEREAARPQESPRAFKDRAVYLGWLNSLSRESNCPPQSRTTLNCHGHHIRWRDAEQDARSCVGERFQSRFTME